MSQHVLTLLLLLAYVFFSPKYLCFYMKDNFGDQRENRSQLSGCSSKHTRNKSLVLTWELDVSSIPNQPTSTAVSLELKYSLKVGKMKGFLNIPEQRNQVLPKVRSGSLKGVSPFNFFSSKSKELLPKWPQ